MSAATSGRTWEDASSPAALRLTGRYEQAWEQAEREGARPDPGEFLAGCAEARGVPGATLAILRADLGLRWDSGDRVGARWYLDCFPDLAEEACVALIYEEFCLLEDAGEAIDPEEFEARYPAHAGPLRRVLEIHQLIGSATNSSSTSLVPSSATASPALAGPASRTGFPEVGQTIGGFYLVEELGRGAFARVFLARERQLADRLVALKVTRRGSREPQALARLQHTHIVPVHSHRVDPATGLHLLCMPYFGRLTLARLLAEVRRDADELSGAGLLGALDRLLDPGEPAPAARSSARSALGVRNFAQAVAWWGARLAEALEHAHDRGVLHRDIKPSNVLIIGDGMPMLLDFNLARESIFDEDGTLPKGEATLGGTIDYMAPEHLEALAEGSSDRVDGRADLYGLGILLYEAVIGDKPFRPLRKGPSVIDSLLRAADERRQESSFAFPAAANVPPPLVAVIRRCLEPLPEDRYQAAAELAADLRAVADDLPLVHAREPVISRLSRGLRRNRRRLAMAAAILVAGTAILGAYVNFQLERHERYLEAEKSYNEGVKAFDRGAFNEAGIRFETAKERARTPELSAVRNLLRWQSFIGFGGKLRRKLELLWTSPPLDELEWKIQVKSGLSEKIATTRSQADALLDASESLRFRLIGMGEDLPGSVQELRRLMAPFYVLKSREDWDSLDHIWKQLDEEQRGKLRHEVNELLFLWVAGIEDAMGRRDDSSPARRPADDLPAIDQALEVCDRAISFAERKGPWLALRALLEAHRERAGGPPSGPAPAPKRPGLLPGEPVHVADEKSPSECFQWGLLNSGQRRRSRAIEWLIRAAWLEWENYWYQFYLAFLEDQAGLLDDALVHYSVAAGRQPESAGVRYSRARLYRARGRWSLALDDFRTARSLMGERPESLQVALELGYLHQALGNYDEARAEYAALIRRAPETEFARAARLNLANIAAESGMEEQARSEYESLLRGRPGDRTARLSRALLFLRLGQAERAEADLDRLLGSGGDAPRRAEVLATRAVARLLRDRGPGALEDAAAARQLEPSPAHERLFQRAALAAGDYDRLHLERPEEIRLYPVGGSRLDRDLRGAEAALARLAAARPTAAFRATLNRAVILAALGDMHAALVVADRARQDYPYAADVHRLRARIDHQAGRRELALREIEAGLELQPDDPGLLDLRGVLRIEEGRAQEGLEDLNRALGRDSHPSGFIHKAEALARLGRDEDAVREWSLALRRDPELPRAFLGRARSYVRLRLWDQALADLEQASSWAHADLALQWGILATYASCLPERPEHFSRWSSLLRRAARQAWGRLATRACSWAGEAPAERPGPPGSHGTRSLGGSLGLPR
jgi:serine/threonine protein kinase/Tfp pilus assembly protein PilF